MIEYKTGDLLAEQTHALVNTVNCVGVMGRGIALQFKRVFPENFKAYAAQCKLGKVKPGHVFVFETSQIFPRYIINFPTKRGWRADSRIEDIQSGLKSLVKKIRERNIQSIAIPPLGSGLGKLDWPEVRACIEGAMAELHNVKIIVYEPHEELADKRGSRPSKTPKMTPGRAVLVDLMDRYVCALLDPFFTLLEAHKLMYFMQGAGEPLRLKFVKAPYGPYAENLRHVLKDIEGYLISGYADGGDAPDKPLDLIPGAIEDAHAFLKKKKRTQERFEKVADLVEGFESSFGLELLSTVHWIIKEEKAKTFDELAKKTYSWNERKKEFSRYQLKVAADRLSQKGWIEGFVTPNSA